MGKYSRGLGPRRDQFGNLYSTKYGGKKCGCLMCGNKKNADGNNNRQSYFAADIVRDEDGWYYGASGKKHSHKMRRIREKRQWRSENDL